MSRISLWLAATVVYVSPFTLQAHETSPLSTGARSANAGLLQSLTNAPVPPGLLVVPLERRGSKTNFYIGNISVGRPAQTMKVLFDTSSNGVIFMDRKCRSKPCLSHKRYSSVRSSTAEHIDSNGKRVSKMALLAREPREAVSVEFTTAGLPTGNLTGVLVRDRVCLESHDNRESCATMTFLAAKKLSDMPFSAMPNDGIVGLGPPMEDDPPMYSFGSRFLGMSGKLPIFGMTFREAAGELHIGGYHPASIAAPLHWLPAHNPGMGYWQLDIMAVHVGKQMFDDCRQGCHVAIDTSVSKLGVQKADLHKFQTALTGEVGADSNCHGPDIAFDLGGFWLTLESADYMATDCTPDLGALDLAEFESTEFRGVFALGIRALRRFFVAFDLEQKSIGIAPATGFSATTPEELHSIIV